MSAPFDHKAMEILRFLLRHAIAGMLRALEAHPSKIVELEACCEALRTLESIQAQFLAQGDERRELTSELADTLDLACKVRDALAPLGFALGYNPMQLFAMQGDANATLVFTGGSYGKCHCIDKTRAISVANALFIERRGESPITGYARDSWASLRYFCSAMIGEAEKLPKDSKARRWIVRVCDGIPRWYMELDAAWCGLLDCLSVWPESLELFERVVASFGSREA